MPIGGKLCLSHQLCSEELDPAVVNFLVLDFRFFDRSLCGHIPRRISTLHRNEGLKQALRGHSFLRGVISGEIARNLFQFETAVVARRFAAPAGHTSRRGSPAESIWPLTGSRFRPAGIPGRLGRRTGGGGLPVPLWRPVWLRWRWSRFISGRMHPGCGPLGRSRRKPRTNGEWLQRSCQTAKR